MTVVMKIDLVGPRRRGLALGLNEAAGYGGVALAAGLSGWLAAEFAARDVLVVAGAVIAVIALPALGAVRARHRRARRARAGAPPRRRRRTPAVAARGVRARHLPRARAALLLAGRPGQQPQRRRSPGGSCRCSSPPTAPASAQIGLVAGALPGVWSVAQIATGHWSDSVGRKPLIVAGMLVQAAALALLAAQRRRGRDRRRRRRAARARHRARLPDADRRDLRRGLAGRARAGRRRLPLLARHGLRRSAP